MAECLSSSVGRFGLRMPLRRFNRLPDQEAIELLQRCLNVDRWAQTIVSGRPYRRLDDLFGAARDAAFPFTGAELEAALAAVHPPPVVPPPRQHESRSQIQLREQLTAAVAQYHRRFARPFLIRKDGRSDAQILAQLWERLATTSTPKTKSSPSKSANTPSSLWPEESSTESDHRVAQ